MVFFMKTVARTDISDSRVSFMMDKNKLQGRNPRPRTKYKTPDNLSPRHSTVNITPSRKLEEADRSRLTEMEFQWLLLLLTTDTILLIVSN